MDDFQNDTYSGSEILEQNGTLTCAAATLQSSNGLPLPANIAIAVRVLQTLFGLLILTLGMFLNSLAIVFIIKDKSLHTVSSSIGFQLCSINLISTVTLCLPMVINHIAGFWLLGHTMCIITGLIITFLGTLRSLLLLIFFLDLFLSIHFPFQYRKWKQKVIKGMCIFVWVFSVSLSTMLVPGLLDCYRFSEAAMLCVSSSQCKNCKMFVASYLYLCYISASIIPVALFLPLYLKGNKYRKQARQDPNAKVWSVIANEWRAIKTFVYLFIAFVVITLVPITMFFIASQFLESTAKHLVIISSSDVRAVPLVWDAIIILRDKNIQEKLTKIKGKIKKTWAKSNSIIIPLTTLSKGAQS